MEGTLRSRNQATERPIRVSTGDPIPLACYRKDGSNPAWDNDG